MHANPSVYDWAVGCVAVFVCVCVHGVRCQFQVAVGQSSPVWFLRWPLSGRVCVSCCAAWSELPSPLHWTPCVSATAAAFLLGFRASTPSPQGCSILAETLLVVIARASIGSVVFVFPVYWGKKCLPNRCRDGDTFSLANALLGLFLLALGL